jgi:hypothetical protein
MAEYTAIRDAVLSVRDLLRRHITQTNEPGIGGVPIELRSPRELEQDNNLDAVSLWLHRVESQPDLLNWQPPRPDSGHTLPVLTPLELCLHVTCLHSDPGTRHLLAGRLAQVFTDHRRLLGTDLVGTLSGGDTVLLLGMEQLGAYELNLLWSSQHTHLRLGIGLRVQGVVIDSHLPPTASSAVLTSTMMVDQIVGSSP